MGDNEGLMVLIDDTSGDDGTSGHHGNNTNVILGGRVVPYPLNVYCIHVIESTSIGDITELVIIGLMKVPLGCALISSVCGS